MGYFYSNIWSPCQTMTQTIFCPNQVLLTNCGNFILSILKQLFTITNMTRAINYFLIGHFAKIETELHIFCHCCLQKKKERNVQIFYKTNVSSFEIVHSQPLFVYFVLFEQYLLKKEWRLQQGLTLWRPSYWSPPSPPPLPLPPPPSPPPSPPLPPWPLKQTSHYATFVAKYMHSLTS